MNHFKKARTEHNKNGFQSVKSVHEETGITKTLIDDLESDADKKRGVSYITVCKLATHYGVSTDYLFGLTDNPKPHLSISDYTGLTEKAIANLIQLNKETGGTFNKFLEELKK